MIGGRGVRRPNARPRLFARRPPRPGETRCLGRRRRRAGSRDRESGVREGESETRREKNKRTARYDTCCWRWREKSETHETKRNEKKREGNLERSRAPPPPPPRSRVAGIPLQ